MNALSEQLASLFAGEDHLVLDFETRLEQLHCYRPAVIQILVNLITNSIKYGDKELTHVVIRIEETPTQYVFEVTDNGPGIPESQHNKLFQLFSIITPHDRNGQKGNGLGLATVKKLVYRMGGEVSLESQPGEGLTIRFSVLK